MRRHDWANGVVTLGCADAVTRSQVCGAPLLPRTPPPSTTTSGDVLRRVPRALLLPTPLITISGLNYWWVVRSILFSFFESPALLCRSPFSSLGNVETVVRVLKRWRNVSCRWLGMWLPVIINVGTILLQNACWRSCRWNFISSGFVESPMSGSDNRLHPWMMKCDSQWFRRARFARVWQWMSSRSSCGK